MAKHDTDPVLQRVVRAIDESGQAAAPVTVSVHGTVLADDLIARWRFSGGRGPSLMSALERASGLLDKLDADDAKFEALLGAFIMTVRDHIEFEETQVWPGLHALLSRRDDRRTGRKITDQEEPVPRAQIKDKKTYRKLRDQGDSKEKSARIANAAAATSRSQVGRKGGKSGSYDDWSKHDLVRRAREIGIKGRSTMSKAQLIKALRDH